MCGILAEFLAGGGIDREAFDRMRDTLAHRGPDGAGTWLREDTTAALGHRRLAIVDLSDRGRQPLANETGDVLVSHNGEIYNYPQLRAELERKGHRFASGSDSETIVHAYEEWGDDCVRRFNGIFAFALWDDRRRRMLLARDQLGVKPLYYWARPEGMVAASEIRAILAHPRFRREVDPVAWSLYLAFRYVPHGGSIFAGVRSLAPGHRAVVDEAGLRIERYWAPDWSTRIANEAEAVVGTRAAFDAAVKRQAMSDVPVGVLLSGGIDSSAVLGRLPKNAGGSMPCFTTGFDEAGFDERPYARHAAETLGGTPDEITMTADGLTAGLAEFAQWHDEPFYDYSGIPIRRMAERARAGGVKVLFSGEGADELFAGYRHYELVASRPGTKRGRLARWLGRGRTDRRRHFFSTVGLLDGPAQRRAGVKTGMDPLELLNEYFGGERGAVVEAQAFDLGRFLADDLLVKVDRASMSVGVEVRVPWLDLEIVDVATGIAPEINFGGERKRVLKQALAEWLPASILTARKKGFGFPLKAWLTRDWREGVARALAEGSLAGRGLIDGGRAAVLVREGRAEVAWLLACGEQWARHWLEGQDGALMGGDRG